MFLLDSSQWEVKTTKNTGQGIFAKKTLHPGIVIGDYLGQVLRNRDIDIPQEKENFYLLYYHDRASIYPNLGKPGIHLLNHSCSPNIALYTHQGHTLFFSLRKIFPGEELTVSYMLSPKTNFCDPCTHICKCTSSRCTRTMHLSEERFAKWRAFQAQQETKSKRKRIIYNKPLPPLESYPPLIPDNNIYSLFGTNTQDSKVFANKSLPSLLELRKQIRETGRTLKFPALGKAVLGIEDGLVISELI